MPPATNQGGEVSPSVWKQFFRLNPSSPLLYEEAMQGSNFLSSKMTADLVALLQALGDTDGSVRQAAEKSLEND